MSARVYDLAAERVARESVWVACIVRCDACAREHVSVHHASMTAGLECPCGAMACRETAPRLAR